MKSKYLRKCINYKQRYVHQWVWEAAHGPVPEGMMIDHKNRDRYDNRIENLRLISSSDNHANSNLRQGKWMRGVTFNSKRASPWQMQLQKGGKKVASSWHKCEGAAHIAYLQARAKHYPGICT